MEKYLEGSDALDLNKLCDEDGKGKGASYASAFFEACKKDYPPVAEAKNALAEFFPILEKLGSEFGFRTASEFRKFASIYVSAGGDPQDAVDFAIMQKLLPKLHGSKRKLSAPLKALWNLCQADGIEKEEMPSVEKEDEFEFEKKCRYPVSAKKILRMVRALDVGFASFAEA
jgi:5-methylcytosine-specific restriction protein B